MRVVTGADAAAVDAAVGTWLAGQGGLTAPQSAGEPGDQALVAIAVDGKTVRGAVNDHGDQVHLLAAATHENSLVLGQVEVGAKTNEIPMFAPLLDTLTETGIGLGGMVITADALHSQRGHARGIDADIFVTERPYLYETKLGPLPVKLLKPSDALAIVGLYLRSQGFYSVFRNDDINFSMGRNVYFGVGAVELLPAAWRWSNACGQESGATSDKMLIGLAGSLIQRVQRALEARDDLHRVLARSQDNETRTRVLSNLDIVLLLLMAASDITARVAHRVLWIGRQ